MKSICGLLAAALCATTCFGAAPGPDDFARGIVVETEGVAVDRRPLYELTVPDAVYGVSTSTSLTDVRVFNAEGVAVPHELCPARSNEVAIMVEQPLPLYELQQPQRQQGAGTHIEVQTQHGTQVRVQESAGQPATAASTVQAHVVDARGVTDRLAAIRFEWRSPDDASEVHVRIEASSDLDLWTIVVPASTLLVATRGDTSLQRQRVELPPRHYQYLRIERSDGGPALAISAVVGEVVSQTPNEAVWFAATRLTSDQADSLSFESDHLAAPVTQARMRMPLENSALAVTIQSRSDDKAPWLQRWSGQTYLFVSQEQRRESVPASFPANHDRYWRVSLPKDTEPSSVPPAFELGYYPARLRFLAQGSPPYLLAFGSRRLDAVPATACNGLLANVAEQERESLVSMAYTGEPRALGGSAALQPLPKKTPLRLVVLWGVLIGGVGMLIVMAFALMKRVRHE